MTTFAKIDSLVEAFEWHGEFNQLLISGINYRPINDNLAVIPDATSKGIWIEIKPGDILFKRDDHWVRCDKGWFETHFQRIELVTTT